MPSQFNVQVVLHDITIAEYSLSILISISLSLCRFWAHKTRGKIVDRGRDIIASVDAMVLTSLSRNTFLSL